MPRGGFGGRGFGGGFGGRRSGYPMMGRGMGMGGMGGSPLLSTLLAGGMGYLFGSNAAQQAPQVQPYPPYAAPYPAPYPPAAMPASADNGSLAKLQLLGQLHESGVLTDDEFARQKQQLLRS